jgi:polyisoprenoid-binding protein YceI
LVILNGVGPRTPGIRRAAGTAAALRRRLAALLALALVATSWAGVAQAGAIRFRVQPEASEVTFQATSRLMNASGRFTRLAGLVVVDPKDLTTARITLSIEAASIDTGIGMRDNHLRSEDFLDVRQYPMATFESLRVEAAGRRATVFGRLSLHGVTREIAVPVDVTLSDVALVATGEIVIDRRDYGITYQSFVNPIGNEVRVGFTFRAHAS